MMANSKLARKLIQASLSGDVSRIEALLSKKVDVNCKNAHDQFPLLLASQHGHKEAVQLLIKGGAHVDLESRNKMTSLSLASECGHHETVEILVENGAHMDHKVSDDRTPLMLASENGYEETVRVLISKNANVNLCSCEGQTALTFALRNKYAEVAKLLLPHVAEVDKRGLEGKTPLMLAVSNGLVDVAELLLKRGARVNLRLPEGSTALMLAGQSGIAEMAMVLLKYSASIDRRNDHGHSALIIASEKGHKEFVQVLLSHNAEVAFRLNSTGETALIAASKCGHADVVKLLLCDEMTEGFMKESMAPFADTTENIDESVSEQCMEIAVKQDDDDVPIDNVCSPSAVVNIVDNEGCTALSVASSRGHQKIVEILIHHGADVNLIKDEKSALARAIKCRNVNVVRLLLKNKASVEYENILYATKHGLLEILKLIIPHCANVDPPSNDYFVFGYQEASALWLAVRYGHTHIVNLLLENSASVDNVVMSGSEEPALVLATIREDVEIVEALLNKGAAVDVTCGRNQQVTPLMLAICAGHTKLVRLFVKHGADVCFKSDTVLAHYGAKPFEFTCMDLANALGNRKMITILSNERKVKKARLDHGLTPVTPLLSEPPSDAKVVELVQREYTFYKARTLSQTGFKRFVPIHPVMNQKLLHLFPKNGIELNEDSEDDGSEYSDDHPQLPVYIPPTINDAYLILLPVAAKWKNIGVLLKIELGKLQNIKADTKESLDALLEMLEEWLKRAPPPTWGELVEAVKPFDPTVSQKIQEKHCT